MTKKSFGNCVECPLNGDEHKMVLFDTNTPNNLKNIDLLIFAESPDADDIREKKPLSNASGKIFKEALAESKLDKLRYIVANVVLCDNIDSTGKDNKPPKNAIKCCRGNGDSFIEKFNPKMILVMGATAKDRFGIPEPITKERGKFFDYNLNGKTYKMFLVVSPSYVLRNEGLYGSIGSVFLNDFKFLHFTMTGVQQEENSKEEYVSDVNHYNYPDWFFDSNLNLFDIQYFNDLSEIAFIFKHKDTNEKIYHYIKSSEYYHYVSDSYNKFNSPMLAKIKDVKLVKEKCRTSDTSALYENDIAINLKHSIDYYYIRNHIKKIPETNLKLDVLYYDIEVFCNFNKAFPEPKKAEHPINAISFKLNDDKSQVFIANINDTISIEKINELSKKYDLVKFFNDERSLLVEFCKFVRTNKIDIITGWNGNHFDIPYIFNRLTFNQIQHNSMSPIGKSYYSNGGENNFYIGGLAAVDMLDIYKELSLSVEESYKLSYICEKNLGKGKVIFEGSLDELYVNDLDKFINYSVTDTDLLCELNRKLDHLNSKKQMIKVASSTWHSGSSSFGLLDPLIISYAKQKGFVCKDGVHKKYTKKIPGGFVKVPKAGLHSGVVDFDFTSLYPSLIRSFNIGPNTVEYSIPSDYAKLIIYKHFEQLPEMLEVTYKVLDFYPKVKTVNTKVFLKEIEDRKLIVNISGILYKSHEEEVSFFSEICKFLMDFRNEFKSKMKEAKKNNSPDYDYYYQIQYAYKIINNTLYGILVNPHYRFFAPELGQSITMAGQEVNKYVAYHLDRFMQNDKVEVNSEFIFKDFDDLDYKYLIYMDTDSSFIGIQDYITDKESKVV